jgi:hypothetical protein
MKKPKIMFVTPKPGQSQEDMIREAKAKHGIEDDSPQTFDASSMDPEELKKMLAGLGVSEEQFSHMMGDGAVPGSAAHGNKKKKTGLFQRIQDAILK